MDKMGKIVFSHNLDIKWSFYGTQFLFVLYSTEVVLTSKGKQKLMWLWGGIQNPQSLYTQYYRNLIYSNMMTTLKRYVRTYTCINVYVIR